MPAFRCFRILSTPSGFQVPARPARFPLLFLAILGRRASPVPRPPDGASEFLARPLVAPGSTVSCAVSASDDSFAASGLVSCHFPATIAPPVRGPPTPRGPRPRPAFGRGSDVDPVVDVPRRMQASVRTPGIGGRRATEGHAPGGERGCIGEARKGTEEGTKEGAESRGGRGSRGTSRARGLRKIACQGPHGMTHRAGGEAGRTKKRRDEARAGGNTPPRHGRRGGEEGARTRWSCPIPRIRVPRCAGWDCPGSPGRRGLRGRRPAAS